MGLVEYFAKAKQCVTLKMIVNSIQELFKALLLVLRIDFISDLLTFM